LDRVAFSGVDAWDCRAGEADAAATRPEFCKNPRRDAICLQVSLMIGLLQWISVCTSIQSILLGEPEDDSGPRR
jgi:hypothetical protein